ncbi:MAG: hypothetical protein JXJ17_16440 [Anaerolineae bacterium]|nr:hypothetical protein [Anaerolineae bacterium]
MNRAIRTVSTVLGLYAGLLGMAHGVFEVRQGSLPTGSILIAAIGAPCQMESAWHACFPAMTLVPNFLLAGILTLIIGVAILVWVAAFLQHERGWLVLILLSIGFMLIGAGFTPPTLGVLAGAVGSQINRPLAERKGLLSDKFGLFLSELWPWPLVVYVGWLIFQTSLGIFAGEVMLKLGMMPLLITNTFLLLMILTGFSVDRHLAQSAS